MVDAALVIDGAILNGIALKGSISYGKITVDFKNSLFFGQPIIDAYLLHENLQMLTVIVDHNFETRFNSIKEFEVNSTLVNYKANLKVGKITHKIIRPLEFSLQNSIKALEEHYLNVSGYPRTYIDNTLEFYQYLLKTDKMAR